MSRGSHEHPITFIEIEVAGEGGEAFFCTISAPLPLSFISNVAFTPVSCFTASSGTVYRSDPFTCAKFCI